MYCTIYFLLVSITLFWTIAGLNKLVAELDERRNSTSKCSRMQKSRQLRSPSMCCPPHDAPRWAVDHSMESTQQTASTSHTPVDKVEHMRDNESSVSYSEYSISYSELSSGTD